MAKSQPHAAFGIGLQLRQLVVLAHVFRKAGGEIRLRFEPLAVFQNLDADTARRIKPACVLAILAAKEEAGVFPPLWTRFIPCRPDPARFVTSQAYMGLKVRASFDQVERLVLRIGAVFQRCDNYVVRCPLILIPTDPNAIAGRISCDAWIPAIASFVAADLNCRVPAIIVITSSEDARAAVTQALPYEPAPAPGTVRHASSTSR